jgi:peptidoglycan/xylan/chitin deacetylase (PgdA/CDA1 family)
MVNRALRMAGQFVAATSLQINGDYPSVLILLFHSLYRNEAERRSNKLYPMIGMSVENFRKIVEYFLDKDYTAISPDQLPDQIDPNRRHVIFTFDDGYFNNIHALPVLREFDIPALFFISTDHVIDGRRYWWDAVFSCCIDRGKSAMEADSAINHLKYLKHDAISEELRREYNIDLCGGASDLDRPLRPDELRDFVKEPGVVTGNHTRNHAILTNYSQAEITTEIAGAQEDLYSMTGSLPEVISYPNGNYNNDIISIARDAGLRIGISTDNHKNHIQIGADIMSLGRFMPAEAKDILSQCRMYRSDLVPANLLALPHSKRAKYLIRSIKILLRQRISH